MANKILLIEDDAFLAEMYLTKFSRLGYDIDVAYDGISGMKKIKEDKPDLLLLDIKLPFKDGFEILKEIRKSKDFKHLPVILLTNLGQREEIEKGRKLGANDYLIKAHFTPQEVVNKVTRLIGSNKTKNEKLKTKNEK